MNILVSNTRFHILLPYTYYICLLWWINLICKCVPFLWRTIVTRTFPYMLRLTKKDKPCSFLYRELFRRLIFLKLYIWVRLIWDSLYFSDSTSMFTTIPQEKRSYWHRPLKVRLPRTVRAILTTGILHCWRKQNGKYYHFFRHTI